MIRAAAPRSTLASLALVPTDRRVSLLVRHSHRPGIPSGEVGYDVGLSTRVEGPGPKGQPRAVGHTLRSAIISSQHRGRERCDRGAGSQGREALWRSAGVGD